MESRVNKNIHRALLALIALVVTTPFVQAQQEGDEFWSSGFTVPGAFSASSSHINDVVETRDGVFITGEFSSIDGISVNSIAYWTNGAWEPLGEGLRDENDFLAKGQNLHLDGDNLYVVGDFDKAGKETANNIAIWNTVEKQWSSLPGTFNGTINTVLTVGTNVYVGGGFNTIDDNNYNHIAVWDGEGWNSFQGGVNGEVFVLKRNDGQLYVGGDFNTADGLAVDNLAIWTGSEWNNFGGGSDGEVYDIHFIGDSVIVGGNFSQLNGVDLSNIGIWTDETWSSFPVHPNGPVYDIEGIASDLAVAGEFFQLGILETTGFAVWNGNNWEVPNNEIGYLEAIYSISSFDEDWIIGGSFRKIEDISINNIARLNTNQNWEKFGADSFFKGASGVIRTIKQDGVNYYVGGSFLGIGSTSIDHLAMWNGSSWEGLGEEAISGTVYDILVDENLVYVAGSFTSIGDLQVNRIAVWDKNTEQWSSLNGGANSAIFTLLKVGNSIYAGGVFTEIDGNPANRIAIWDGNNWSNLGNGVNGTVHAMIEYDGKLFVGGSFNEAGLDVVNHIAAWNGENWEALGDGLDAAVYDLVATDSSLIMGGEFENSPDGEASHIVEWVSETDSWKTFGLGFNDRVEALHIHDGTLYAGGKFTREDVKIIGGGFKIEFLNSIAVWADNSKWEPLGSGITRKTNSDPMIYDITSIGDELLLTGRFDFAGTNLSNNIASWDLTEMPTSNEEELIEILGFSLKQNYPNPFNPTTNISFELSKTETASLRIFNILGQEVTTLINGRLGSGEHTVSFDATNLSSGVYIYQLKTSSAHVPKKMLLIK